MASIWRNPTVRHAGRVHHPPSCLLGATPSEQHLDGPRREHCSRPPFTNRFFCTCPVGRTGPSCHQTMPCIAPDLVFVPEEEKRRSVGRRNLFQGVGAYVFFASLRAQLAAAAAKFAEEQDRFQRSTSGGLRKGQRQLSA